MGRPTINLSEILKRDTPKNPVRKSYADKLKSPKWQRKRLEILERDNYTCQYCGDTETMLVVHHLHYRNIEPWEYDHFELITICDDCHKIEHSKLTQLERYLWECVRNRDSDEKAEFRKLTVRVIQRYLLNPNADLNG